MTSDDRLSKRIRERFCKITKKLGRNKKKRIITLGDQEIDIFDISYEKLEEYICDMSQGLGDPTVIAKGVWEDILKDREKISNTGEIK